MSRSAWVIPAVLALLEGSAGAGPLPQAVDAAAPRPPAAGTTGAGLLIENRGQWADHVRFAGSFGGLVVWCEDAAIGILAPMASAGGAAVQALRLEFENATVPCRPAGQAPHPGRFHFFAGADPARWRRDVPAYTEVVWRGIWPGADLVLRNSGGRPEYDLHFEATARPDAVRIRAEGCSGLEIDSGGTLVLASPGGRLLQSAPVAWIDAAGTKAPVRCGFRLLDAGRFGFAIGARPVAGRLVIDPRLEWSTYLGGAGSQDDPRAIAVDALGRVYVAGATQPAGGFLAGMLPFPTTAGALSTTAAGITAFVTCLAGSGNGPLVYSTFLGGAGADEAAALHVSAAGEATVGGWTQSSDFPTTAGAFQSAAPGGQDGWVARLDATGSSLLHATCLGGSTPTGSWPAADAVTALAVDAAGRIIAAGWTASTDFPGVPGGFDTTHGGREDGFVVRLDPALPGNLQLVSGTFLGGSGFDRIAAMAFDAATDEAVVAGRTEPESPCAPPPLGPPCPTPAAFPTTGGAYQTLAAGAGDGFVVRLSAGQAGLVFSTLLGGAGEDAAAALGLAAGGETVVAGQTWSGAGFPVTAGALQTAAPGGGDGFVVRLNAAGAGLVFSTFLGGAAEDACTAVALPSAALIVVAGASRSADLPVTLDGFARANGGVADGFVAALDAAGATVAYTSYLGGFQMDAVAALAVAGPASFLAAGTTSSSDFPSNLGVYDTTLNGLRDAFVARIDLDSPGTGVVEHAGRGDAGTDLEISSGSPVIGNAAFGVRMAGGAARAWSSCMLAVQDQALGTFGPARLPLPAGAPVSVVLDGARPYDWLFGASDAAGDAEWTFPLPPLPALAGARFAFQGAWFDGLGANGGISLSRGLRITVGGGGP